MNAALYADGNAYLHELCRINAAPELVREAVLHLGAGLDVRNKKDMTPLGVAILSGNAALVQCLLDLGSEMSFEIDKNRSFNALFLAIYVGHDNVAKTLLENQADLLVNKSGINAEGKFESLPCLHMAVKLGRMGLIRPLIAAGAFLDMEGGPQLQTPLHIAADGNAAAPIAWLLEAGADLDRPQSGSGMTALHYALQNGRPSVTKKLLEAGADIEAVTAAGLTPLMFAAGNADLAMTRLLLDAGANPDARRLPGNGETALMRAAAKSTGLEVVRLLLNAGADPLLTDAFNRTASHHADAFHFSTQNSLLRDAETRAEQKFFEKKYRQHRP